MNYDKKTKEKKIPPNKKQKTFQSNNGMNPSSHKHKDNNNQMKKQTVLELIHQYISVISPINYLTFYKTIKANLFKFDITKEAYEVKIINDIIFDENKRIVSVFKNNLVWDESSDFLKRFYFNHESMSRIPKIASYYQKYTIFPPVYFKLECCKLMMKNTKKKKKVLEMEEEKNIDNSKPMVDYNKDEYISYFIKPEEVNNDLTKSQSQFSYVIRKIYENDQFNIQQNGINTNADDNANDDIDITLSQYINDSEWNNRNLSDIIDDLSVKHNTIENKNNINVKKNMINLHRYSKAKTNIEMNKLNFDFFDKNSRQIINNKVQNKTERITPSKKTSNRNHIAMTKPRIMTAVIPMPIPMPMAFKTIEQDNNCNRNNNNDIDNGKHSLKRNVCLNVFQIMNIPKPIIESHSNKNDSEAQMKYRKLVLDFNNNCNTNANTNNKPIRNDKSPNNVININRNLVFSNDKAIRKNTKQFVKLPSNDKVIKSSTNTIKKVHMKKYLKIPLTLINEGDQRDDLKRTNGTCGNLTNSTTTTGNLISKPNRNSISSSNTQPNTHRHTQTISLNIKVNLRNQSKTKPNSSLTRQITTPLTTRNRRIELSNINKNLKASINNCSHKQIKSNGKSQASRTERYRQKYSRNSKTLLQTNYQSTSIKRIANGKNANNGVYQTNKPSSFSNSYKTIHNYSSINSKNITININKQINTNNNSNGNINCNNNKEYALGIKNEIVNELNCNNCIINSQSK